MVHNGKTISKWMIWGYHHFRKVPFHWLWYYGSKRFYTPNSWFLFWMAALPSKITVFDPWPWQFKPSSQVLSCLSCFNMTFFLCQQKTTVELKQPCSSLQLFNSPFSSRSRQTPLVRFLESPRPKSGPSGAMVPMIRQKSLTLNVSEILQMFQVQIPQIPPSWWIVRKKKYPLVMSK